MASNGGISWLILTALHSWSYWINWKVFTTLCYLLHITWWNPKINSGNNEVRLSNSFIKIMQGLERLHVALGVLIAASCQHHKCPESYIEALQLSMLTFELSSYSLEIPNDAYSTLSQEYCTVFVYIGNLWEGNFDFWTLLACPLGNKIFHCVFLDKITYYTRNVCLLLGCLPFS